MNRRIRNRISVQSVYRYLSEYESEIKTLHDPRGGSKSKLDELQSKELLDYLQKTTYLYVKEICKYVKIKYGLEYSRSGMTFWLKDHGFVYKQPIKIPGKLDPEKQEAFIAAYEALKSTLPENEEIYFMDAVHPEFQSKAVCGWIKKGEIKTLPTTSAQYRMHFVGAIALKKMEVFVKEYETVDAESIIAFFKALEGSSNATTIHIIGKATYKQRSNQTLSKAQLRELAV